MIKVGCCGWCEPHGKYFRDFAVIEVQETFYQPGRMEKYEKWRAESPRDFEFTLKAWQLITHEPSSPTYRRLSRAIPADKRQRYGSFRLTDEVLAAWEVTKQAARALRSRIIVFQCPASFQPDEENRKNVARFFTRIDRGAFVPAWEPRGAWADREVKALCRELELVHVVDPFKGRPTAGRVRYFRLHGLPGYDLSYRYSDADLQSLASMAGRSTIYMMFNNISMFDDATRLKAIL